jgi:hypothetical protein
VASLSNSKQILRRTAATVAAAFLFCAGLFSAAAARPDQPPSEAVGAIDGEAIAVSGPMSVEVVHGQVKTILRSGSDVRVKSGTARIDLVEGGQIAICGPAHLSVLRSGGSLTVALDTGTIHVHIEHPTALTIYTPQIQAQPVAIGDDPQDVLVGFDTPAVMCVRASRGAVRVEQQLTGQSILIPQAGDVLLINARLDSLRPGAGRCSCDLQIAKTGPPPQSEISQIATAEEVRRNSSGTKPNLPPAQAEKPAEKVEPVYQVFVPPLIYDANAKVQPDIDPRMIVLVRRVRVRPTLIFQGRVEGEAIAAVIPPATPTPAASSAPAKPPTPASDSLVGRVLNFVRKLWSRSS